MWPLRVYTRKKRAGQRLNLTPAPDLGASASAEAPTGPGRRLTTHGPKGNGTAQGLLKIAERAEWTGPGCSGAKPPSSQLGIAGEKSLQKLRASEEAAQDEKITPLSKSVTDDLQVDRSLSAGELVSELSSQYDISSSLLSYSTTESYTECKSFEENLSSFPSPELFRGSDYLDWECPKLEEYIQLKNSTLLDTSKAVAIEKAPQFSNLSSILATTSSGDYQKCHRKMVMTLADENISPKPKSTSNSESDNEACEVLAEKTYPLAPEKTQKKPGKDPEPRDTKFQTKLSSHLKMEVQPSHQRSNSERDTGKSVTKLLPARPLEPTVNTNPTTDKKSRGLLTSTPTSQTAGLEIDLSSVQKASLEELFPNVSNCVNSDEIVPVLSLQEIFSNEVPSNTSEICCIIRASPGTRQVKSKSVTVKKKKFSPPKDIPQDIIIKANGKM